MRKSKPKPITGRISEPILPKHPTEKDCWVALLIDTSTTWGRNIITGAANFAKRNARWELMVEAHGMEQRFHIPKGFKCSGVIARVSSEQLAAELKALKVPVVNVSTIQLPNSNFPVVKGDAEAAADLAIEHLLSRGYRRFAYVGFKGLSYAKAEQSIFYAKLKAMGYPCTLLDISTHRGAEPNWAQDLKPLISSLKSLPKPVGIFTWNASSARELIYACQEAHLHVPDEVAVLSGSEDDLLCEMAATPISAILQATQMIGFRAAQVLDGLMHGRSAPSAPVVIPPLHVVTRQSTDTFTLHDEVLARALNRLKQDETLRNISVGDLASHAGVSRRVLERRFREVLQRSPANEIRWARLECARRLLLETDLNIFMVGETAGFPNQSYFARRFSEHFGMTPNQYRQRARP